MKVGVYRILMSSPADTSGLERLVESGEVDPRHLVCAIGKTEGNGGANDFTRGYATLCFQNLLNRMRPAGAPPVVFGWSGGTEGVLSPHVTFFTREPGDLSPTPGPGRLAISVQMTRDLLPEEVGTVTEVQLVAEAVSRAMAEARVARREDVHLVFVKGPLLTPAAIEDARRRGVEPVTADPNRSKAYARGAMALGVAVALGEVDSRQVANDRIAVDMDLFSQVALTSAGAELTQCEIILLANSPYARGDFQIGHGVLRDAIDVEGVLDALKAAGLAFDGLPGPAETARIAAVFAKAEAGPGGQIRGFRHTMLSDADINYERHARAAVGGMIAAVTKNPALFISGGTEHQCAPGEAPIAVIVKARGD